MEQTEQPSRRKRRQPRTPFERAFSGPLSHPFWTSFVVLPVCIAVVIWFANTMVGETRWPAARESVELCIIYVNGGGRLRKIEDSHDNGFEALQEKLLQRIAEGATFVLPAERQGEPLRSYDVRFSYRILGSHGEGSERVRAHCESDSGRFNTTVYEVSPDLILPISFQNGFSPLTVAAWSYPVMGLVVLPILYVAGKRTRDRLKRRSMHRAKNPSGSRDPAPLEFSEVADPARRKRRRRRRRSL